MTQRISEVVRNTNETKIRVRLNLDGTGQGTLNTGVPFLDHMIDQIKRHGLFDIDIHCDGDLEIDDHHTVEDCGITLGQAFAQALGDKKGLRRYGHFYAPLDEALSRVVVDLSGRPGLFMDIPFTRKGIGYLPQEASIFRKLTIAENIMAILETRKDLNKQQRQQRLTELLNDFKINHIKDSLGMSVSGGERRRAEIARALAADPKFMLLDEPFAGVDPISVGDIKDIIQTLKERGIGVLITDHNVRETLAICEKAYIVSEGSVIAEGTPQEILDNEQVRKVYLGDDFVV